jgi:hypothetical protein
MPHVRAADLGCVAYSFCIGKNDNEVIIGDGLFCSHQYESRELTLLFDSCSLLQAHFYYSFSKNPRTIHSHVVSWKNRLSLWAHVSCFQSWFNT